MKDSIFLVEPNVSYKNQFEAMVCAYKCSDEIAYFDLYKEALEDFDKYVLKLQNNAKGIDIPEDWVTTHTFWLTNKEGKVLGVTRVRTCSDNEFVRNYAGNIGYDISPLHRQKGYGRSILKLGLEKAKSLGLDKLLVTCNYDNVGSIKIIENNGGIFESEVFCESKNTLLRRYWIEL
jgi:predicted acetyltransferase